jgi:hypothetical protein
MTDTLITKQADEKTDQDPEEGEEGEQQPEQEISFKDEFDETDPEDLEPSYHDPQGETNMARITEDIKRNNKIKHKL